jgi:hypothetical protein
MPRTLDTPGSAPAAPGEVRWITVGALLGRWPWLVVPAVLLCAAGIAVGLLRAPTYTARAELTVGRASVLSAGLSGLDQASANLAQVYSRLVASDAVTDRVARRTGASPAFVRAHVSAAPVVNTSVFAITAVGATRSDATRLSDAALEATTRYIGQRTDPVALRRRVLLRFRAGKGRRIPDGRAAEDRRDHPAAHRGPAQAERRGGDVLPGRGDDITLDHDRSRDPPHRPEDHVGPLGLRAKAWPHRRGCRPAPRPDRCLAARAQAPATPVRRPGRTSAPASLGCLVGGLAVRRAPSIRSVP